MSIMASSLIHNKTLRNYAQEYVHAGSVEQRYLLSADIEQILNTHSLIFRGLIGFYVILSDGSQPIISRNYSGINLSSDDIKTYAEMADANRGFIIFPDDLKFSFDNKDELQIVSLAVSAPADPSYANGIKTLLVSFVANQLMDFIRQNNREINSTQYISDSFLVGRNRIVLSASNINMIGSDFDSIKDSFKKSFIIMSAPLETTDWTIVEAVNIHTLTRPVNTVLYALYAALILIVVFFIRYNTFFFARIINPLKAMIAKMEAVGSGDFSVRSPPGEFIELNKISESFNFMVKEISVLTDEIKSEQKERLKAEIEALRYQLNPHFLCNALNSIRMMAIITKNDAVKKMSAALMTLTEDILTREDTVYSLEHEMQNLDNYIYIMKVRYGDTFEYITDVDSSLLRLGVPSMILQPLVENAILHGFHGYQAENTGGHTFKKTIVVAASRTDAVLSLSVRDNGQGMTEEVLSGVFEEKASSKKGISMIGLSNVRKRIILSYGQNYDVHVFSFPGEGTVVTLTLPVMEADAYESRLH